jgi:Zn-dependent peptidase ImmA (M78 family)/transcriptional regulator with XRE-family HTH domain
MPPSQPALVEGSVLRWARESCGLDEVAAGGRLGVPWSRVAEWEEGVALPTIAQLKKACAVYRRSLGVFFLSEPPTEFDTLRDFRRHIGGTAGAWSAELHAEFRRALVQHEYLLELAETEESDIPTDWRIDPLPEDNDGVAAVARVRLLDEVGPIPLPSALTASPYDHLNAWIAALEAAGVLVLATAGGQVDPAEARALSLYFDEYPVIMVNGADSARGRLFSLLHEYAHLLLHTGGLCDTVTDRALTDLNRRVEARCNAIAASMLMPASLVLASPQVRAHAVGATDWDYSSLSEAAAAFGASADAFLLRLLTLGRVNQDFYDARHAEFQAAYLAEDRVRPPGGDWYRNTVRNLGKGYVRQVADAHRRRVIGSATAATYLDVKVSQIRKLAEYAELRTPV